MASLARTARQNNGTHTPSGSPSIGEGRAVVAVVVVYVLMLYHLPLVPLLAHVLHRPSHIHAPCTSAFCYCKAGCQCSHHNAGHGEKGHVENGHAEKRHAETPSFSTCGVPGAATLFVIPVFDKALLAEGSAPQPRALPPLAFAGSGQTVVHHPILDIFHPPRLA